MIIVQRGLQHLRCQKAALYTQWRSLVVKQHLAIRTMATASTLTEVKAGFDVDEAQAELNAIKLPHQGITHARAIPGTPSYFSRTPKFSELLVQLTRLRAKYNHLPLLSVADATQPSWYRLNELRDELGEEIKAKHFTVVIRLARRLFRIEPQLKPAEISAALKPLLKPVDPQLGVVKLPYIDKFGRSVTIGRRKEAKARAFLVEGTGEIYVNGRTLSEAFGRVHDRESAIWALTSTRRLDKYNAWVLVEGGGTTGQAEAVTLAIGRGLVAHEPALKPALRKAGCISRDPRMVERKLHGHLKARKSPAWVKR